MVKGFDDRESLLAGVLLIQLLVMGHVFTDQSDQPYIYQGLPLRMGELLFTLAYGNAGFYILERQFKVNFSLTAARTMAG